MRQKVLAKREVLIAERYKRGLNIKQMAEFCGMSNNGIAYIEQGGGTTAKTAKIICEKLGKEFDELFYVKPE